MSERISDERLAQLLGYMPKTDIPVVLLQRSEAIAALQADQRSRELMRELRALAERIHAGERGVLPCVSPREWAKHLDKLLTIYGAA